MSNSLINNFGVNINKGLAKLNLKVIRYSSFKSLEDKINSLSTSLDTTKNELNQFKDQISTLEEFLKSGEWFDSEECLEYVKQQLDNSSVNNETFSPTAVETIYNKALRASFLLLSSGHFLELSLETQVELIQKIFIVLITLQHRQSIIIAHLISNHFYRILNDASIQPEMGFKVYESLYGLYWCGATCLEDMKPFDRFGVYPFLQYINRSLLVNKPDNNVDKLSNKTNLNIAYLCHYAHFDRGNAIAPIITSMAKGHSQIEGRKIFIYCVQWVSEDFMESFKDTEIIIRPLPQQGTYQSLEQIIEQIKADKINVLLTDVSSSIATYLFVNRVAPLQFWLELGYPYWTIPELDWVFLCAKEYQPTLGVPSDRCSYLMPMQEETTLKKDCEQTVVDEARQLFPPDCFLLAVFTRLIKITPTYLDIIRHLLKTIPQAHMLIVGTGDPSLINQFLADNTIKDKVTFLHKNVDLNIYGRVVDVFLDTFPFIGGNACREVAIHGTPIVAMYKPDFGRLLLDERDPDLLAYNEDEYIAITTKLASDSDFYQEKSQSALKFVEPTTDLVKGILTIEEVIKELLFKG
ncbi:MAG: hypothetical protein QNJ64_05520 [Crocosphaera sp.]|nr:hypothetical protein [Crocosphaera sp.]